MTEARPIAVDAHKPPTDEEVICYCRGGFCNQMRWRDLGFYSDGRWYLNSTDLDEPFDQVTHWYPVPKLLPEEALD